MVLEEVEVERRNAAMKSKTGLVALSFSWIAAADLSPAEVPEEFVGPLAGWRDVRRPPDAPSLAASPHVADRGRSSGRDGRAAPARADHVRLRGRVEFRAGPR